MRSGAARDANVAGLDFAYFTPDNRFQVKVTGRYSNIFGYSPLPSRDNSSYYVNLIEDTVRVNNRLMIKPYSGFKSSLFLGKVSGKIQYSFATGIVSSKYDPNDMGYLPSPNEVIYDALASYNQLIATDKFISYQYTIGTRYSRMYKPNAYSQYEFYGKAFWVFKNFWDVTLNIGSQPFTQHDYFELRTANSYLQKPAFHYISTQGSTDSRKKLYISYSAGYARTEVEDGNYYQTTLGIRYRFSNRFTLLLDMNRQDDQTQIGYAFERETDGRPVIGYRRNLESSSVISGVYNFAPRLNLTLRTRHYWNQVTYKGFFNVASDGSHVKRTFIRGKNENYNLFNTDAFLTWDFRLGSRVIVGYKNWLGDPYGVMSQPSYLENLKNTFRTSHGHELTIKLIYFLDYNQLRKKH